MYADVLRATQGRFALDISRFIKFAFDNDFILTFGEAYRTKEQQEIHFKAGRSKTMNSKHMDRLAVDFNIFKGGRMLFGDKQKMKEDLEAAKPLGFYWMELSPNNTWGADFNKNFDVLDESFSDPYHFQTSL